MGVNSSPEIPFDHLDAKLLCEDEINKTPIEALAESIWLGNNVHLYVKREDLCHPIISGNKWHKLRLNISKAKSQGAKQVLSFGGAWSNHIHALAYVCHLENINFIAVVRGDELANKPLNPTLSDVESWGGQLVFVSREDYRKKNNPEYIQDLQIKHGNSFVVPEGGANFLGVEGSALFAKGCLDQFFEKYHALPDYIVLACGSGTMAAGFLRALESLNRTRESKVKLRIYAVVKDESLREKIAELAFPVESDSPLAVIDEPVNDWHLSFTGTGFGASDADLLDFIDSFESEHGIALDPVYNGKLFRQINLDIGQSCFPEGSKVLAIHSGGLQGARSRSRSRSEKL